jgi:transcription antitermination factor NusG
MDIDFQKNTNNKNWVVLYTKSRREKKVAEFCNMGGILNYLPLERRLSQYGSKMVFSMVPLFPGYLFCCCDQKDRYNLLMTHHVARVIRVADQFGLLRDIERLYEAQNANLELKPCAYYEKGKRVKILSGPLCGYEGIVQRIKGQRRLVLAVDFIRQAASIEVDQFSVVSMN